MSRRKKTVAEAEVAEAASVFTAPPEPEQPMAIVFDDFYSPVVVQAGKADIRVIRIYEVWDDEDLKITQADVAAIERILPFIPEGEDRALLIDAKEELETEIAAYAEYQELSARPPAPIEGTGTSASA